MLTSADLTLSSAGFPWLESLLTSADLSSLPVSAVTVPDGLSYAFGSPQLFGYFLSCIRLTLLPDLSEKDGLAESSGLASG